MPKLAVPAIQPKSQSYEHLHRYLAAPTAARGIFTNNAG